jgi:hypothetical protein
VQLRHQTTAAAPKRRGRLNPCAMAVSDKMVGSQCGRIPTRRHSLG